MDASLVRRFVAEQSTALAGAQIGRVACTAEGLVLGLQGAGGEIELGWAAAPGAAWVWSAPAPLRARLHDEITAVVPALTRPEPVLGWRDSTATALDALRAWVLRPAAQHAGWNHLLGCRIGGLEALGNDRILDLQLVKQDAVGRSTRLVLRAQLFEHGANIVLTSATGSELANRTGRPPATPRPGVAPEDAAEAGPLDWDAARGAHLGDAPGARRLSMFAAAHLDLAVAFAAQLLVAQRRVLRRREAHLANLLDKLDVEAQASQDAEHWRREGELLSANLHRVRRGQSRITVEDLFDAGKPRDIGLDPQLSPQDNVALLFKRARRGARGQATILARQAATRTGLQDVRALLLAADGAQRDWVEALHAAAEQWRTSCPRDVVSTPLPVLWAAGGPPWSVASSPSAPEVAEAAGPGRRFVLSGGWEVRVGRSNAENDELTHGFARPDDVWMHASGVAGSHVVLRMQGRNGNPPRDVLEAAAAIAAHFSKARHSKTVPVLWTRKRYVRKPRGAKPGLASCTQEKTLFVRPALPAREDD